MFLLPSQLDCSSHYSISAIHWHLVLHSPRTRVCQVLSFCKTWQVVLVMPYHDFIGLNKTHLSPISSQKVFWYIFPDPIIFIGSTAFLLSKAVHNSSIRIVCLNVDIIVFPFKTWHRPASVKAMWKGLSLLSISNFCCETSCMKKCALQFIYILAIIYLQPYIFGDKGIFWLLK